LFKTKRLFLEYIKLMYTLIKLTTNCLGRCGRDRMVIGFIATYMESVPITTNVVS
jgi:hypothetical protein